MTTRVKRARLTIDLPAEVKRRLRLVADQQDVSVRDYVVETIEKRLARDWPNRPGKRTF
jgi:predicted HicB family RNase H-like nuclease